MPPIESHFLQIAKGPPFFLDSPFAARAALRLKRRKEDLFHDDRGKAGIWLVRGPHPLPPLPKGEGIRAAPRVFSSGAGIDTAEEGSLPRQFVQPKNIT